MNVIKLDCMRYLYRQLSVSSSLFGYKSAISLDNIYPTSNLKLTTPTKVCFSYFGVKKFYMNQHAENSELQNLRS
jgi:hypothetical protein